MSRKISAQQPPLTFPVIHCKLTMIKGVHTKMHSCIFLFLLYLCSLCSLTQKYLYSLTQKKKRFSDAEYMKYAYLLHPGLMAVTSLYINLIIIYLFVVVLFITPKLLLIVYRFVHTWFTIWHGACDPVLALCHMCTGPLVLQTRRAPVF